MGDIYYSYLYQGVGWLCESTVAHRSRAQDHTDQPEHFLVLPCRRLDDSALAIHQGIR